MLALLGMQLADVDPGAFTGTGLVWTSLWVGAAAAGLVCLVRAASLPSPVDVPEARRAEGPEARRIRRALRDRTPLRPDDKQREIDRIRADEAYDGPFGRWSALGVTGFLLATSLGVGGVGRAPVSEGGYQWLSAGMFALSVGAALWFAIRVWHGDGAPRPTSQRRRRLEDHPTTHDARIGEVSR